jgi:hypothetical protein
VLNLCSATQFRLNEMAEHQPNPGSISDSVIKLKTQLLVAHDSANLTAAHRLKAAHKHGHAKSILSSIADSNGDIPLQSCSGVTNSSDSGQQRVKFFPYAKTYPTFGKHEYKAC